ncbi:MAG: DNA-binding transcriptional LysR family regulator [Psychromonas sp.]|jgi:DNA-binding transcriptional LysR family regulator
MPNHRKIHHCRLIMPLDNRVQNQYWPSIGLFLPGRIRLASQTTFVSRAQPVFASALKFRSHFIANNGELLISAAIEGAGVTIQPTFIAAKAIKEDKLQAILPAYAPEPLGLYALYTHRKFLASKVRCFIDFISDYYGDIPYWDSEV